MAVAKGVIMRSLRLILISSVILFIALFISLSFPSTSFPSFKSWLQPPYLYIIINLIILAVAFSSRLHHAPSHNAPHPKSDVITSRVDHFFSAASVKDVDVAGLETVVEEDEVADLAVEKEDRLTVDEMSTWSMPRKTCGLRRQEAVDFTMSEKPLVTSRFGHHRKPAKLGAVEGGKALRVAKPKKHDTFESTWKAITEGRHVPLTRHIKNKSDTWQYQCRQINLLEDPIPPPKAVKKSETFKDGTNKIAPPVALSKLKKEPSLGQDELNRRVEAFINKFNEEMRLQRQQSMQQFLDKINRAV